mgnify:CR=1 FL=1
MVSKASQDFVQIKEIRDGVVVLKDGSLRMVLMASSLNFALKSNDEQAAIISQYQNFLNSLDFSIQIFIQSRPININPYIDFLKETEKNQSNELIQIQTREYTEFIKTLVETANIVTKNFYIVVPFNPPSIEFSGKSGILNSFTGLFKKSDTKTEQKTEEVEFEEHKEQLNQRVDVVLQELARLGVRAVPLGTEEVVELYYYLYNPGESEKGKIPMNS